MDVFFSFHLGSVHLVGVPSAGKNSDGTIVTPAEKLFQLRPELLFAATGPYENSKTYLTYLRKRFELKPATTLAQAVDDLKWLVDKEEMDGTAFHAKLAEFHAAVNKLKQSGSMQPSREVMDKIKALMQDPIAQKVVNDPPPKVDRQNPKVNHVYLSEISAKGCKTYLSSVSEDMVVAIEKFADNKADEVFLEVSRIQPAKKGKEEGKVVSEKQEYLKKYIPTTAEDCKTAVLRVKQFMLHLHQTYTTTPYPLQMMQAGAHTDFKWSAC